MTPFGKCAQCGREYRGWALRYNPELTCECGGRIDLKTEPEDPRIRKQLEDLRAMREAFQIADKAKREVHD